MQKLIFRPEDIQQAMAALYPCASKKDAARPHLSCVFMENCPKDKKAKGAESRRFIFVATDGHKLGMFHTDVALEQEAFAPVPEVNVCYPIACVEFLMKIKPKHVSRVEIEVGAEKDNKRELIVTLHGGVKERREFVAETFYSGIGCGNGRGWLDYERVQPAEVNPPMDEFQAVLIEQLAEATTKGGAYSMAFAFGDSGGGPVRVLTDKEGFSFVLMPLRKGRTGGSGVVVCADNFEDKPLAEQLDKVRALLGRIQPPSLGSEGAYQDEVRRLWGSLLELSTRVREGKGVV
jgi:hypothetical protein